jgi:hypothetical protein
MIPTPRLRGLLRGVPRPPGALFLGLAACVSTDVASQVAPEFAGVRFARTLVVADVGMLNERTLAEDRIVDQLLHRRMDAVRSLDVVFAADTLPADAFLSHAARAGADAVLILRVIDEGTSQSTTPGLEEDGFVTGYASSTAFGGRTAFRPWARFRATLIETATGRTAWFADAECRGSGDSSARDLVADVAREIATRLASDGVLSSERRF